MDTAGGRPAPLRKTASVTGGCNMRAGGRRTEDKWWEIAQRPSVLSSFTRQLNEILQRSCHDTQVRFWLKVSPHRA